MSPWHAAEYSPRVPYRPTRKGPNRLDPDVSFHSLRHGFRDALREAGVPIDATRALGGWARSGGIEERYGQGTRAATLAHWMAKVDFPGLDLSPLAQP